MGNKLQKLLRRDRETDGEDADSSAAKTKTDSKPSGREVVGNNVEVMKIEDLEASGERVPEDSDPTDPATPTQDSMGEPANKGTGEDEQQSTLDDQVWVS